MTEDFHVMALCKGEERYIFIISEDCAGEARRTMSRYAVDPELSFTWHDAAVMSQKLRNEMNNHGMSGGDIYFTDED